MTGTYNTVHCPFLLNLTVPLCSKTMKRCAMWSKIETDICPLNEIIACFKGKEIREVEE